MPLYKRSGSPFWWVRIGRKTRRTTGTENRKEAEEFEEVLRQRLWRVAKLGDRSAVSWNEAAKRWLKDSSRARVRDQEILKWLEPKIGLYPVSSVADPDVIEMLRELGRKDGWAYSTIDRAMHTVRSVLRRCVVWRYLEHAPHVPMYNPDEDEPHWLTRQEVDRLCGELPEHLALAARLAVLTLLRMRSMSQLTWERIDLQNKRAWVPRAQMKGSKTFGFPLSSEAVKVLRELRKLNPEGSAVFQWKGAQIKDFNTAAFKKAVERAELTPLRWHDLRHTGASWAVQNGVTLPELMQLGDWKSYEMVLRYAHFAPVHAVQAAERVAQMAHSPRDRAQSSSSKTRRKTA